MGRQKIREELSAALAKGYLTRMDQYNILLHAKEVLTANDLNGFEQRLNRIAAQQAAARAAKSAVRREAAVQHGAGDSALAVVTPSKYEEVQAVETPVISGPTPTKAKRSSEGPSMEEVPVGHRPALHPSPKRESGNRDCDPEGCGCDPEECHVRRRWIEADFFSSVDAFKGPIDIGNANGNFGVRLGVNAAVPILPRLGVGLQAGTATVLSNLEGSPYPEPNATIR